MKKGLRITILFFSLFVFFASPLFCAEDHTPLPYDKSEFPQSLNDLRRFEIITLGSMPFITLDVTLAFSGYNWYKSGFAQDQIPNPFANTAYTPEEQKKIILTSLGISCCVGLSDFLYRFIKRTLKTRKLNRMEQSVLVTPIDDDPDAIKLDNPHSQNTEEDSLDVPSESLENDDVIEVIE